MEYFEDLTSASFEKTEIKITPFTSEYQKQAKELILQGIEEYVGKLEPGYNEDLNNIEESFKEHLFLIVLEEGKVIGTGGLLLEGEAPQIVRVSVKKEYRRQELGRRIVDELISYAVKNGYKRVIVETSKDWSKAVNFYFKYGFEIMYYKDGDIYFKYDKLF